MLTVTNMDYGKQRLNKIKKGGNTSLFFALIQEMYRKLHGFVIDISFLEHYNKKG